MRRLGFQWRYFWSRRTRGRLAPALICALLALLTAIYLAIPASDQSLVSQSVQQVSQVLGSVGLNIILEVALVVFFIISLTLLLAPDYRAYSYLALPGAAIPAISVYVDAENEPPGDQVASFVSFLRQYLDGRRADLLFFSEAATSAGSDRYIKLARYGFRSVDVPHDPTGMGTFKEAVDHELSMHAFERALVGPAQQEFILFTHDGDYIPLIYRLCALGHRVQVWSTQHSAPYAMLANYLNMEFVNLSEQFAAPGVDAIGALSPPQHPAVERKTSATKALQKRRRAQAAAKARHAKDPFDPNAIAAAISVPPVVGADPGLEKLYRAIEVTRRANDWCHAMYAGAATRAIEFHKLGLSALIPWVQGVGYSSSRKWFAIWCEHLTTLGVFDVSQPAQVFTRGPATTEAAARQLYALAQIMARSAVEAISTPDGKPINILSVASIIDTSPAGDMQVSPLWPLIKDQDKDKDQEPSTRLVHIRYIVWCARALGILQFDDVNGVAHLLGNPRLGDTAEMERMGDDREAPNIQEGSVASPTPDVGGPQAAT